MSLWQGFLSCWTSTQMFQIQMDFSQSDMSLFNTAFTRLNMPRYSVGKMQTLCSGIPKTCLLWNLLFLIHQIFKSIWRISKIHVHSPVRVVFDVNRDAISASSNHTHDWGSLHSYFPGQISYHSVPPWAPCLLRVLESIPTFTTFVESDWQNKSNLIFWYQMYHVNAAMTGNPTPHQHPTF